MTCAFVIVFLAYLVGSLPTGYIVSRLNGVDIRHHGSGNIGATNVLRILGPWWGGLVFLVDAGKGLFAVLGAAWLNTHFPESLINFEQFYSKGEPVLPPVIAGILGALWAVIGHSYTLWLEFKGGKGVATSLGAVIGLVPWAALAGLAVWGIVLGITRIVSVASMIAVLVVPVVTALTAPPDDRWILVGLTSLLAILIILRHKKNIERLRRGTETRIGEKKR